MSEGERDEVRGGPYWSLRVELPEADVGTVNHLSALLEVRTEAVGFTSGTTSMWVNYQTEDGARAAMALVLAERPEARCSVEIRDSSSGASPMA